MITFAPQTAIIHQVNGWRIVETFFGERSRGVISARRTPSGSLEWQDIQLFDAISGATVPPQTLTMKQIKALNQLMVAEAGKVV